MANFGHGGDAKELSRKNKLEYNKIIDFSANINPLGMPASVKEAIIDGLKEVEKYPDITYFELKSAISEFENIDKESIILGNGAAEVLFNIVRGLNPQNALILAPTFSEYEEATRAVSGNVIYYNLKEENKFKIQDDILEYINRELDVLFICNPNNPTGVITPKELLIRILMKAKENDVITIIDESFLDFIEEDVSMISYVNEYNNLIIIKSLTKFFALPGLRIGYGISGNSKLKREIEKITPAWNINTLAEIAAKIGIKDKKYITESIKYVIKEKEYLYNELKKNSELKLYEPSVNFILIKTCKNINLKEELLKRNILIRSCSNYERLNKNYYRIAVRTHEENVILIEEIRRIFEEL
ncbi:threonine-phosphate decarboxylase [Clostridium saccharoperbutylacetonicum]|uniref:threonine-phosphate decarboxylase n=1 Tax=Clostridium saccharoperbutylacetonicum N1-4(HMT) TaxID=931276 RepID=M1MBD5_9CLOT|nr:threonine-phosphate decarboxylase CobD [Clostridium saccharoperbutylacetonicum]AGF55239.1 threonine-phosphate decarboxylase CobD [Clostridium saccharoperbutylacetonicum N1-4(HMT)]NRT64050.1 threonine-phosphate decarboxylase [Clostridium saccharoperbutylacetonicum]NSB27417.1 threonine-phosphate decarboxylase [Clostridium saccharoperbutylacetonicum]NSB40906.1 threonine-phosphate decarboxylase [Clostridium saccharoperbutylacetonicum]